MTKIATAVFVMGLIGTAFSQEPKDIKARVADGLLTIKNGERQWACIGRELAK